MLMTEGLWLIACRRNNGHCKTAVPIFVNKETIEEVGSEDIIEEQIQKHVEND